MDTSLSRPGDAGRYLHQMQRTSFIALLLFAVPLFVGCDPRRNMTPKQIVDAPSNFNFSGSDYPIAYATISGWLNDPVWCDEFNNGNGKSLQWSMECEGTAIPADDLGPPRVSFDGLDVSVSRWQDIESFTQSWSDWETPYWRSIRNDLPLWPRFRRGRRGEHCRTTPKPISY